MSGRPLRPPWAGPFGLYRPGSTPLHRMPPGLELAGLAAFSLAVVLLPGLPAAAGGACLAAAVAAWVRAPWRAARGGALAAVLVGTYHAWAATPAAGLAAGLDLLALVLAGVVLVATTPADAVLDAVAGAARPLRRFGVRPQRAALAAVLMVRAVPTLAATLAESRDAARARGADRSPRTWLTPAAVRAVARAHRTGEALAARGLPDD